jgi:hypothetical protein
VAVSARRVGGDAGGAAEQLLCRADEPGIGWAGLTMEARVEAVCARPAQDGHRFGILDVERARRLAAGEDVADRAPRARIDSTFTGLACSGTQITARTPNKSAA